MQRLEVSGAVRIYRFLVGETRGKETSFEDPGVVGRIILGRIILKWVFWKWDGGYGLD
jgi:hypothetical protein